MKTTLIRIAIVIILLSEVLWVVSPHFSSMSSGDYQIKERIDKSSQTKNAQSQSDSINVNREPYVVVKSRGRKELVMLIIVLTLDGIIVTCFWNYGSKRRSVNPVQPDPKQQI